ncbi:MAG TPA: SLC13 family permease [Burkholderiaceae bacterium]|nr:SLC13 family permease [Burkholderiaceae bacterium]
MSSLQSYIVFAVFAGVILLIAFNAVDMTLAAMLGASLLMGLGLLTQQDILNSLRSSEGMLSLLFGGMLVARALVPTGIFEYAGRHFLRATRGSGKRFLLMLVAMVAPICAFLPNATTVILLAPIIIRVAIALEFDFVGPMILTAIVSNSAGLLTLVGDPATFLVGSSIGMTFGQYLRHVSLGGLIAVLVVIPLLPKVMPEIWNARRELPSDLQPQPLARPGLTVAALTVLTLMIGLFMFGEDLPSPVIPPSVAFIAGSLALLVIYSMTVEPVGKMLADVDWKTLIFLLCMFWLVEAVVKTGIVQTFSLQLYAGFGSRLWLVALVMLATIALASSVLANTPVVAAAILLIKGYLVVAEIVPELALGPTFNAWPKATLPLFIAMMFGGTLGGNSTLIGAAANVVSAGICAANGKRVTFVKFLRYGIPITLVQLAASAIYVMVLFLVTGR